MPQDELASLNTCSGNGLSTPREGNPASILQVRRLPTLTVRSPEERPVVNAGSKECSRCELPVYCAHVDRHMSSPFTNRHGESGSLRNESRSASHEAGQFLPRSPGRTFPSDALTHRHALSVAAPDVDPDPRSAREEDAHELSLTCPCLSVALTSDTEETTQPVSQRHAPVEATSVAPPQSTPQHPSVVATVAPQRIATTTTTAGHCSQASHVMTAATSLTSTRRRAFSLSALPNARIQTRARASRESNRPRSGDAEAARARRHHIADASRSSSTQTREGRDADVDGRAGAADTHTSLDSHTAAASVTTFDVPVTCAPTTITATPLAGVTRQKTTTEEEEEWVWYTIAEDAAYTAAATTTKTVPDALPSPKSAPALPNGASIQGAWLPCTRVPDDLVCEICLQLAVLPHTTDCGHLFCRDCLDHWLRDHQQCPTDRQPLRMNQVRYDRRAERQIGALPCRCPGFRPLEPNTLGQAVQLFSPTTPLATSGKSISATATAARCAWAGCLSDAATHLRHCPAAPVSCPFAMYGCPVVAARADMPHHIEAAATPHNTLLLSAMSTLQERHRELAEEVDVLRPRCLPTAVLAPSPRTGNVSVVTLTSFGVMPSPTHLALTVTARYIWAVANFSHHMGRRARRQSHLLSSASPPPGVLAVSSQAPLPTAGDDTRPSATAPRLMYSSVFSSAPLPAAADMRDYLEGSFSFSSVGSGPGSAAPPVNSSTTTMTAFAVLDEGRARTQPSDATGPTQVPPPVPNGTNHQPTAATSLQWYVGLASHPPPIAEMGSNDDDTYWDIYLFGHRHPYRTVFRLTIYHGTDPSRDVVHLVDDWQPAFMGKGWGPTNFINPCRLEREGYVVRDCLRVGVEIIGNPF